MDGGDGTAATCEVLDRSSLENQPMVLMEKILLNDKLVRCSICNVELVMLSNVGILNVQLGCSSNLPHMLFTKIQCFLLSVVCWI